MADIPTSFACFVGEEFRNLMTHEATGELIKVEANGMGWMLVKYGVFEKMKYPYFYPRKQEWPQYNWEEFVWDDVEFCLRAREAGFDVWVDPNLRIGHEKTKIL